jgi:aminoglycoside phosphotransferase (APT) family kinase protein
VPSLDPPNGVIPTRPEELTPEWLGPLFTRHGYSAAIEGVAFEPLGASALTSRLLRVVPRVQDETTGFAPPLIWKRSLEAGPGREAFRREYASEVAFYRDVAPTVRVSVPRCFAAAYDEASGEQVLLLAEVAGSAGDLASGVTPEAAAAVLGELARLHAARWSDGPAEPAPDFGRLGPLIEEHAAAATPFLTEHVDGLAAERTRRYASEVAELFGELAARPQALVHGDAHPGNVIFPPREGARPVLLDWQGSGIDAPMRDVGRLLVLGLTSEDRAAHQGELLDTYLEELASRGVHYERPTAERALRVASVLQWGWAVLFQRHAALWDAETRAAMPVLVRRAAAAFDSAAG